MAAAPASERYIAHAGGPPLAAIEMYLRPTCPYCRAAQELLGSKNQDWSEVDINAEPDRRAEMIERSGRTTVPQIWIDGRHVGGYDDLSALASSGELDRMLAA